METTGRRKQSTGGRQDAQPRGQTEVPGFLTWGGVSHQQGQPESADPDFLLLHGKAHSSKSPTVHSGRYRPPSPTASTGSSRGGGGEAEEKALGAGPGHWAFTAWQGSGQHRRRGVMCPASTCFITMVVGEAGFGCLPEGLGCQAFIQEMCTIIMT